MVCMYLGLFWYIHMPEQTLKNLNVLRSVLVFLGTGQGTCTYQNRPTAYRYMFELEMKEGIIMNNRL